MTRSSERGSALVTSVVIMASMMMLALPLLDTIDRTQARTTTERVRESSYNVAEAAMGAQTRVLTSAWPHIAARAIPAQCVRASSDAKCPRGSVLAQDFAATDFDAGSGWVTEVRDNLGTAAAFYDRATLARTACAGVTPCTWDSNADGVLWVRAEGTIRGRTRALVAQVRQQMVRIPVPRAVVSAGRLTTSNNGRKTIVDSKGCLAKIRPSNTCNSVQPATVVVRCTSSTPATPTDGCLGYRPEQVAPNLYSMETGAANLLTPKQLEQVRAYAIQAGTYRNSCPVSAADMAGGIMFVEPVGAGTLNCVVNANGVANSATAPGTFIINRGSLVLGGNVDFYGIVYASNNIPAPSDANNLIVLQGNAYVQGGVFADGRAGVVAGSSGLNISFDENAFGGLRGVVDGASVVQNSFRELPTGR